MKKTEEQKIKKLVEEESYDWLLDQIRGEEDEVEVSGGLKELFEDKDIKVSFENIKYLNDTILAKYYRQLDEELENADE